MTQPKFTNSQVRQWARILDAARATESQPAPKPPPSIGGTEIPAQKPEVRMPKHQWVGWEIELERARRRGDI